MPRIEAFLFDDENEEKIAVHGVSIRQVDQILDDEFVVVPNRRGRRTVYLLIGRDHGGTCLAVPVEPTHDSLLWRPVTAWRCKDQERATLEHKRSR